ncbi:MAG: hypothetical protein JRJ75_14160 [Deltaproteobacteria bacterium]|nr:hypothetical protein [Deltaproteobacteria bacterium]
MLGAAIELRKSSQVSVKECTDFWGGRSLSPQTSYAGKESIIGFFESLKALALEDVAERCA